MSSATINKIAIMVSYFLVLSVLRIFGLIPFANEYVSDVFISAMLLMYIILFRQNDVVNKIKRGWNDALDYLIIFSFIYYFWTITFPEFIAYFLISLVMLLAFLYIKRPKMLLVEYHSVAFFLVYIIDKGVIANFT